MNMDTNRETDSGESGGLRGEKEAPNAVENNGMKLSGEKSQSMRWKRFGLHEIEIFGCQLRQQHHTIHWNNGREPNELRKIDTRYDWMDAVERDRIWEGEWEWIWLRVS